MQTDNNDNIKISIPKERLAEMPVVDFELPITIVDSEPKAKLALEAICREQTVGFDTETRPTFRKGQSHNVALIQVSTPTQNFLFRIHKLGLFEGIKEFMENPEIKKIGLSLKDDFLMLHKLSGFEPQGFVDLQDYVKAFNIQDASLQKIYGILFGKRISKGQRLTNWEAPELSEAQCRYAALDAWACLHIYNYLRSGGFHPCDSPYKVEETDPDEKEGPTA